MPQQSVLILLLAAVAGELALLLVVLKFAKSNVREIADSRSNEPNSPLGLHKRDEDAHERMREKVAARMEARLLEIEGSIDGIHEGIREELHAFRQSVVEPLVTPLNTLLQQNTRIIEENSRTLDFMLMVVQQMSAANGISLVQRNKEGKREP